MNFFQQLFSSPLSAQKPQQQTGFDNNVNDTNSPSGSNVSSNLNRFLFGNGATSNAAGGSSTSIQVSTANLTRFHKNWSYINSTLSAPTMKDTAKGNAFTPKSPVALSQVHLYHTDVPACISSLADILIDEEARMDPGSTGLCMEYLLKHNVIQTLSDLAANDEPKGILGETLRFLTILIEGMNDQFLVHLNVHRPTIDWIQRCASQERLQGEYEELWIELMLAICTKISAFPDLLTIFLHDSLGASGTRKGFSASMDNLVRENKRQALQEKQRRQSSKAANPLGGGVDSENSISIVDSNADLLAIGEDAKGNNLSLSKSNFSLDNLDNDGRPEGRSSLYRTGSSNVHNLLEDDFLLFAYLLKFIHLEDKSGDYSRTCLLLLFNNVIDNKSFARYVLRSSDFFMSVVVGLQALFAPLPKMSMSGGLKEWNLKLVGTLEETESEVRGPGSNTDGEEANSWQRDLVHFLNLLDFAQNCVASRDDMALALRDHMEEAFMKRVWMPCWAQCFRETNDCLYSFMIFYSYHSLKIIHLEPVADLIISYLLAEDMISNISPTISLQSKKKKTTPSLFSLFMQKMFHQSGGGAVEAPNAKATVILTARFVSLMLDLHGHLTLPHLLPGLEDALEMMKGKPWISKMLHHKYALNRWIQLLSLSSISASGVDDADGGVSWFHAGYELYLTEAQMAISSHLRSMNWNVLGTAAEDDAFEPDNDAEDDEPPVLGLSMDELAKSNEKQKPRRARRPRKVSSARDAIIVAQPWRPSDQLDEEEKAQWSSDNEILIEAIKDAVFGSSFIQSLINVADLGGSLSYWNNDVEVNLAFLSLLLSVTACPNPLVYQTLCHGDLWSRVKPDKATLFTWTRDEIGKFRAKYEGNDEMRVFLRRVRKYIKGYFSGDEQQQAADGASIFSAVFSPGLSTGGASSGSLFFDSWITGGAGGGGSEEAKDSTTSSPKRESPLTKLGQKLGRKRKSTDQLADKKGDANSPADRDNAAPTPEQLFERDGVNLILLEEYVKSLVAQLQVHATQSYEQHLF